MKKESDCNCWLSAYIYFDGGIYESECDKVIINVVEPFLKICKKNEWFKKYFFIRYSERGPHVRLRFYSDEDSLNKNIKPSLEKFINEFEETGLLAYPTDDDRIKKTSFLWVPYEPEINRYGGAKAIHVAESFFYSSSETALKLIPQFINDDRSSRLGKGLLTTLILIYVFLEDRGKAALFSENYCNGYLTAVAPKDEQKSFWVNAFDDGFDKQSEKLKDYVNLVWEALLNNENISEELDRYKNDLSKIKDELEKLFYSGAISKENMSLESWYSCVRTIVSSYVHMMNNRLGISIKEESYLSYLINKALLSEEVSSNEN